MKVNKMNDIKSFVILKYPMITNDKSTWHLCEKYPESVNKRWALRCARDVEHLDETGKAKKCNDLNERYQAGEIAVLGELKKAANDAYYAYSAYGAYHAAYYATHAAYHAAHAAYHAAYHAAAHAGDIGDITAYTAYGAAYYAATDQEEKWTLYIQWLIEELCEYESSNIT